MSNYCRQDGLSHYVYAYFASPFADADDVGAIVVRTNASLGNNAIALDRQQK
jgi:hypothetical protein